MGVLDAPASYTASTLASFMARLKANVGDVTILVIGDSTGA